MAGRTTLVGLSLVLGSALAQTAGAPRLSFYLLVAAIPVVALATLLELGEFAERGPSQADGLAQLSLAGGALVATLVAASARADMPEYAQTPLAATAIVGCLAAFGLKAFCSLAFGGLLLPQGRLRRAAPPGQRRGPEVARQRRRLAA